LFEPDLGPPYVVFLCLSGVLFKAIEHEYDVVLPREVDHAIPSAFVRVLQLENAIADGLHRPDIQFRGPPLLHSRNEAPKSKRIDFGHDFRIFHESPSHDMVGHPRVSTLLHLLKI
jgi:hypothetical protein